MNRIELEIPITYCTHCQEINELYTFRPYSRKMERDATFWRVEHRCPACHRRVPVKVKIQ